MTDTNDARRDVTLQLGVDLDKVTQHLDLETARKIAGPGAHYDQIYSGKCLDGHYQIMVGDEFAGTINATRITPYEAMVGFWLRPEYRQKGIAYQSLRQVLDTLDDRVEGITMGCWTNNQEAMAFLDRIGMPTIIVTDGPREYPDQYGESATVRFTTLAALKDRLAKPKAKT
jgi:ribosomal protein S18 acetylase RimI-like enzyme